MFKLTFLGTSSGVPTKNRNVTGLAVETTLNRDWWLVDCGEGTQHRLQHLALTVHDLAGICITHVHGDHTYGLPGFLASAAMGGRKRPLILIAPLAVKAWLEATMLHTELFLPYPLIHVDVAPGPLWGRLQAGHDVTLGDGSVLAAAGVRVAECERAAIVVGGDNDTPALLAEACAGAQLLVHEATYTEAILQKVGPGPTHSSVQRVAQFATVAALTHFSARYDNPQGIAELEAEARLHYAGQLHLAEDLASYELGADGVVRKA